MNYLCFSFNVLHLGAVAVTQLVPLLFELYFLVLEGPIAARQQIS